MRLSKAFACLLFAGLLALPAEAATCPGADLVTNAADAFIAAARSGSASAFGSALSRYTDVDSLALFALGKYRNKLPPERRNEYVRYAHRYMSEFLADHAGRFKGGSSFTIGTCSANLVQTVLAGGSDIVWKLSGSLIQDVKVSGVWLAPQLKLKFVDIIRQNHGYVTSLIDYLGRHAGGGAEEQQKKS